MKKLVYAQAAQDDLAEITGYFATLNEQAADDIYNAILDTAEKVAAFPLIGRSRPDLGERLYSFLSGRYIIVYTMTDAAVIIVRVLDGRRDIPGFFAEDGD